MNLVRSVTRLGGRAFGAVPLGGENGRTFAARAASEGLAIISAVAATETRCCTIIVQDEPEHPTEVNEPGAEVDDEGWTELAQGIARLKPTWLAVCGALPSRTKPERLLSILKKSVSGVDVAVDGGGQMLAAALQAGVGLISPNIAELAQLVELLGWAERGKRAAARVNEEFGVEVLLSDGANGAGLFSDQSFWAKVVNPVRGNPIGSGDTLLGVYLLGLNTHLGLPVPEAKQKSLKYAVAAAAANVAVGGGVGIDPQTVTDQLPNVTLESL